MKLISFLVVSQQAKFARKGLEEPISERGLWMQSEKNAVWYVS